MGSNPTPATIRKDNMGEAKRTKEAEEAKKLYEKKEAFEKDPSLFIDLNDVLMMAVKCERNGKPGWEYLCNPSITDSAGKIILFDLNRLFNERLDMKEFRAAQAAKETKPNLVLPSMELSATPDN